MLVSDIIPSGLVCYGGGTQSPVFANHSPICPHPTERQSLLLYSSCIDELVVDGKECRLASYFSLGVERLRDVTP